MLPGPSSVRWRAITQIGLDYADMIYPQIPQITWIPSWIGRRGGGSPAGPTDGRGFAAVGR